ncbi:MAG: 23S rRNA (adenine(2503)-C(2))-methyltransferase RlmN [Rikenellaceae bacterium]|jgi:23S rRNA (adenine2503-C2)-methyltransferase|nr:23S rRNA (adenine(2503)-C(2))-methyltransferase RlmN [Rikenellaceae bacterium]
MGNEWLFGKTLTELEAIVLGLGMPRFTARQVADWLYKKQVASIEEMSNLSLKNREKLSEQYVVGTTAPTRVQQSADGTKKYLFPTLAGKAIEAAYIPDRDRATLCVSSQAGCRMGCRFCMTARQGFQHNLTAGEIVNQIRSLPERETLTNVVYMGMGEPLDNVEEVLKSLEILTAEWGYGWSPTRITVSTIGVLPALSAFLERSKVHLAVSLHNPLAEERLAMMPAQNAHPIDKVIREIKKHDFTHQRRVSFEYILFSGINDSPRHIKELVRLTAGLKCRVNLIRWHAIPGADFPGSDEASLVRFRDALNAKGIIATIRTSRGQDIDAACGMLSTKENNTNQ